MIIGAAISSGMVLSTMLHYLKGESIIKMPSIFHIDCVPRESP